MTLTIYKWVSVLMSIVFGLVGILFLLTSGGVLMFFNHLSGSIGFEQIEPSKEHFYLALAVAYMYAVGLLAFLMYRNPRNPSLPFLLFNAKAASSIVSLFLYIFDKHLLIYAANAIVDGLIGSLVFAMYRCVRRVCE